KENIDDEKKNLTVRLVIRRAE
ncbi:hypothetical protein Ahia01_000600200, partial [Argonauta hians]